MSMQSTIARTQFAAGTPFEPLRTATDAYGGVASVIESSDTQNAIEEVYERLRNLARLVISNEYNGTFSNNSFLGRNNLLPNTPIRLGRSVIIRELVFQNEKTNKNFNLDIYKNGKAPGNLVTTLVVSTAGATGQIFSNLNISFAANDFLYYRYRNISGSSPSDTTIDIYCETSL